MYPGIQEKASNEIIYDVDVISKLKYVDCVLNETMSMFPVVSQLGRVASKNIKLKHHTIPKGSIIVLYINKIHCNRLLWGEDADKFDPDRFHSLHGNSTRPPYAHIPFSGGRGETYYSTSLLFQITYILYIGFILIQLPFFIFIIRNCIGHRYVMIFMKIQMCHLLTHFKLTTDVKMTDIRLKYEVMNRFVDGYKVQLQHRK